MSWETGLELPFCTKQEICLGRACKRRRTRDCDCDKSDCFSVDIKTTKYLGVSVILFERMERNIQARRKKVWSSYTHGGQCHPHGLWTMICSIHTWAHTDFVIWSWQGKVCLMSRPADSLLQCTCERTSWLKSVFSFCWINMTKPKSKAGAKVDSNAQGYVSENIQ